MATHSSRKHTATSPAQPSSKGSVKPQPSSQAQNLIHYLLNHIADEVMLIDREARIVFVNDATIKGMGLSRNILLRRRVTDFLQRKMSVRTWQRTMFWPIKKSRVPYAYRLNRTSGSGHKQIIDVTAVYMPYKAEEYILSVARDRTREINLQDRLSESENLFRLISEGAGDGIFACDLHGNLTYVNPALENLVGVKSQALQGRHFINYIAKDSFSRAQSCFNQAKQGAGNIREEIDLLSRRAERIPVEINVSPLYKKDEIVSIHAVVRDIRNRRNLEMILRQSEKMQAIQSFVSGMAKEIQGPLYAVMALARRLTDRYKKRNFEYIGFNEFSDMMRVLEEIHSRAKSSYETTQRLIDLSKKRSGLVKKSCYPNEVILAAVRSRQEQLRLNNIQLRLRLARRTPPVTVGRIELSQVVDNIFANAFQAMPGGGVLTVRSRYSPRQVQVDIQDTGVGIPTDVLPHIFEPFFTTKQHGTEKSSGLGLPIARELLKATQGEIDVHSNLRQGTTVTIRLPAGRGKNGR